MLNLFRMSRAAWTRLPCHRLLRGKHRRRGAVAWLQVLCLWRYSSSSIAILCPHAALGFSQSLHLSTLLKCLEFLLCRAVDHLHLICIIRIALHALVTKPVKPRACSCRAIIASDPDFGLLELTRHGLCLDGLVKLPPLKLHVDSTATADWAFERRPHECVVAWSMHIVAALYGYYGQR